MMGLALGSLRPPAASSRDESQALCLCRRLEELGFVQVFSWTVGDMRGRRVGEKQGHSGPGMERGVVSGGDARWRPARLRSRGQGRGAACSQPEEEAVCLPQEPA